MTCHNIQIDGTHTTAHLCSPTALKVKKGNATDILKGTWHDYPVRASCCGREQLLEDVTVEIRFKAIVEYVNVMDDGAEGETTG